MFRGIADSGPIDGVAVASDSDLVDVYVTAAGSRFLGRPRPFDELRCGGVVDVVRYRWAYGVWLLVGHLEPEPAGVAS